MYDTQVQGNTCRSWNACAYGQAYEISSSIINMQCTVIIPTLWRQTKQCLYNCCVFRYLWFDLN